MTAGGRSADGANSERQKRKEDKAILLLLYISTWRICHPALTGVIPIPNLLYSMTAQQTDRQSRATRAEPKSRDTYRANNSDKKLTTYIIYTKTLVNTAAAACMRRRATGTKPRGACTHSP